MAYQFKLLEDVAVPETVRGGGGRSLGFPFDTLKPGKVGEVVKGKSGFYVPRDFWVSEVELPDAEVGTAKKGPGSVPDLKDRIRRSFYGWKEKDEKRENYTLVFEDDYDDKTKAYKGVNVYLTVSDGATSATPAKTDKKDEKKTNKAA